MDTNEYNELKAMLLQDKAFRRLVLDVLRTEIAPSVVFRDPNSHVVRTGTPPPGMITYAQAAELSGYSEVYIRQGVTVHAYFSGGGGLVVKQDLVNHVMTRGKRRNRILVAAHLDEVARTRAEMETA